MLEKIQIRNFQRHELLRIKLDPKITTITGDSDVGKSSVLRAIRWVALNRPRGNGFIRRGQDSLSVNLWVDGEKVTRLRDKKTNQYTIGDNVMEAVATTVPDPVARLLNLDDTNFKLQHDPPLWFGLSPGEVAKRINSIVDLGLIDQTLSALAGTLRTEKIKVVLDKKRWDESKGDLAETDHVPRLDEELQEVEELQKESSVLGGQASFLRASVQQAIIYQDKVEILSDTILGASGVLEVGRKWIELIEKRDGLAELTEKVKSAEQRVSQPIPDISDLDAKKEKWENLRIEYDDLSELVDSIKDSEDDVKELEGDVKAAEESRDEESEGLCPICGNKISR